MQFSGAFPDVSVAIPSTTCSYRSPDFRHFHIISDSKSAGFFKSYPQFSIKNTRGRSLTVKASGNSGHDFVPVAPVQLESPVGQLLGQILQTHPHLLPAAIDQQLENLQKEREAKREAATPTSQDLLLYKRGELLEDSTKAPQRKNALKALNPWGIQPGGQRHLYAAERHKQRMKHEKYESGKYRPSGVQIVEEASRSFSSSSRMRPTNSVLGNVEQDSWRIAQVKEKEKQKTLEEIIYCWIVQKFVENKISMIPKILATSDPTGRADFWPNQEQKLETVHSDEAFEMIQSHLELVIGERVVGPLGTIIQISKIKLGKLYAASIMYGYFLRRVDQRFQLERSMNTLPKGFNADQVSSEGPSTGNQLWDPDSLIRILPDDGDGGRIIDPTEGKINRLRSYVMYLDAETLQRYATLRSKEAISLIEQQTQALFGRPDIRITEDGSLDASNDEVISLTFSGLTMLVLEAVTFGSFLWDAEGYVESKYHFIKS
ncbi:hypothetical protein RJ639_021836 [Escallonia herrerae]|uniref:Uncharacterized protein n=1 Tax=Escallonia herrerae TaxID=1293975 RepID=A0AA88V406_9ASTE|nr:hypothetical protein RJ639_021836 [Escallonia herrerae]